jgi:hypothetical protein
MEIKPENPSLHCHECSKWTHANCEGFLPSNQSAIQGKIIYWECPACCLPNVSTSFFSVSNLELSNVFSNLEDSMDETNMVFRTDEIVTSSPKQSNCRSKKDQNTKPDAIKVMLVNCRSLKSERKQHDFLDLVKTHQPDVIFGQESHIDGSFSSSEVFPTGYTISRKDRNVRGGGVFVAITDQLVSTTEYSFDSKCEIIWCKISIVGSKPLYIASFYRPTNDNPVPLTELNASLNKLSQNGSLPNIILGGDFNLPSIEWSNHVVKPNPQYGYRVNRLLLDTIEEHGLHQHVHEPTCLDNILDLLFTTNPDLVEKVNVFPGMSDHGIVTALVNIKAKLVKKPPRKVYIFSKMNEEVIKKDAGDFNDTFFSAASVSNISTNDSWTMLKSKVDELLTSHVPQKQSNKDGMFPG